MILRHYSLFGIKRLPNSWTFVKHYRNNAKPTDSHRLNIFSLHPNIDHIVQIINNYKLLPLIDNILTYSIPYFFCFQIILLSSLISSCTVCWAQSLSYVWLFETPWTVALQAPRSMGILQARILEWAAMTSSRGSSQLRDQMQVPHIAGRFFTIWATREAQEYWSWQPSHFSRGSFWPRNQARVSCIVGIF